tara:strand:+ start:5449 stop:5898 length:450 start_codon:yes stop_codon:yes gene_type:complete
MDYKGLAEEYFKKLTKNYGYEMGLYNAIIKLTTEGIPNDEFYNHAILLKEYNDLCLKMENIFNFSQEEIDKFAKQLSLNSKKAENYYINWGENYSQKNKEISKEEIKNEITNFLKDLIIKNRQEGLVEGTPSLLRQLKVLEDLKNSLKG